MENCFITECLLNYDFWHDIASLAYATFTVPAVILFLTVLIIWKDRTFQALKISPTLKTSANWFVMGVWVSFLGKFFDTLYWAIPWSLDFIEHNDEILWNDLGVFQNIPMRLGCGIAAAYCHVRAFTEFNRENNEHSWVDRKLLHSITYSGIALGVCYSLFLCWLKWWA